MAKSPATSEAECGGPKYDAPGVLSAQCIACGKCDAVQRLLRELVPAQMNNETMRTANAAR
ncbi:MAG TPA: hypothetical protein VHA70_16625 [Bauldia sp.]|nr:hypothetical protein [Bauldia sp.]